MMPLRKFEYFEPKSVEEATRVLAQNNGDKKILAGGTDLLVRLKRKEWQVGTLVNIKKIPGLNSLGVDGEFLRLGALTTLEQVSTAPAVLSSFPILAQAVKKMASLQIRNVATVVGNLCNASPAADMATPLLCLDAQLRVKSLRWERVVALTDFFHAPGKTALQPDEMVLEVLIPMRYQEYRGVFTKFTVREAMDISIVNVAVLGKWEGKKSDVRIALGAVAPKPIRAKKAEETFRSGGNVESCAQVAASECSPIDDIRGSAWYRREIVKVLVRRCLTQLGS